MTDDRFSHMDISGRFFAEFFKALGVDNPENALGAHIQMYFEDPVKAHALDVTPLGDGPLEYLLLETKGRKSGETRYAPLIYKQVDGNYIVIGSKGGATDHPAWIHNIDANPDCHVRVGPKAFDATARTAEGAERERLWDTMEKLFPVYAGYKEAAGERVIPVVVLEPN